MLSFKKFSFTAQLLAIAIAVLAFIGSAPSARAGFEVHEQDQTVPTGSSSVTTTITLARGRIVDVIADVPALDAGDTSTLVLKIAFAPISGTAKKTYTPRTWTDKALSGTQDDAVVLTNSSALDVHVDGLLVIQFNCATNQVADRKIRWRIHREY